MSDSTPPPGAQAGDESYRGFRITEMWAVTAVDPADDQEGVAAIPGPSGDWMPLVGSDRMRKQSLLEPAAEALRAHNPTATVKRFALVEADVLDRPDTVPPPSGDPEWQTYVSHVQQELIPKVSEAGFGISLIPDGESDIKFAIELGLLVMMDKPILAVRRPGTRLSQKLLSVVDEVVDLSFGETETEKISDQQVMNAALDRMTARLREAGA